MQENRNWSPVQAGPFCQFEQVLSVAAQSRQRLAVSVGGSP